MFYITPKNIFVDQLLSLVSKGVKSLTELEANMSVCNAKLVDLLRVWAVNCVRMNVCGCLKIFFWYLPVMMLMLLLSLSMLRVFWFVGTSGYQQIGRLAALVCCSTLHALGKLLNPSCARMHPLECQCYLKSGCVNEACYIRCLQCSGNVLFKSQSIYQDNMLSFKYLLWLVNSYMSLSWSRRWGGGACLIICFG